ncbi:cupin domain-containing protein [Candidatus Albibeggiatoa sp. nov. NOAA]|uniref:cupin domain-containing protein n=1 Tax=Candidatus Albibeggiatoa sp. nov. NOAA TaxID=3162724 RepID=UPI0032F9C42D|nr:cupin domain-containing protein [Thiotrichaceae bacterium]
MEQVTVEHNPAFAKLEQMAVYEWNIKKQKVSQFDWKYEQKTTYYLLDGEATIDIENQGTITVTAGDLVIFPAGIVCHWNVTQDIEKHFKYE